ncbi:hypothetical protein [Alteromonas sp. M12]|uniref:hypothetical protein n=1 Tax=Alteromonas sp. M12 TaxID=3135644 RepID=UPI00319E44FD
MKTLWFNILLMSWVASFSFSSVAFENQQGAVDQSSSIVEQAQIFSLDPLDFDFDAILNSFTSSSSLVSYAPFAYQQNAAFIVFKNADFIRGPPSISI